MGTEFVPSVCRTARTMTTMERRTVTILTALTIRHTVTRSSSTALTSRRMVAKVADTDLAYVNLCLRKLSKSTLLILI